MISFDGTYRLKPPGEAKPVPRKDWGYAWRVRIIDFSMGQPDVQFLKPMAVFIVQNHEDPFKTSCAESMGKRICRDFELDVESTLWIEHFPTDDEPLKVAVFRPRTFMGPDRDYAVSWRAIRPNEFAAIEAFIPEIQEISC